MVAEQQFPRLNLSLICFVLGIDETLDLSQNTFGQQKFELRTFAMEATVLVPQMGKTYSAI